MNSAAFQKVLPDQHHPVKNDAPYKPKKERILSYDISLMLMTYLMSYVLYLIHLKYFSLMLDRVMLTCDSFALVGWTSTPKGGLLF